MLALETETKRKTKAPEKLLEAYLANARLVSDSIPKRDAKEAVRKNLKASASMLSDFKKSPEAKRIIREKEKQLSEKAAKFPFKTKLNYAVDAEYGKALADNGGGAGAERLPVCTEESGGKEDETCHVKGDKE